MSDAISIAASGLRSEEYFIDKIASDLANLNTPSYKASTLTFEDVLYENINGENPLFAEQGAIKLGMGAAIVKSGKDFSTGPLKPSSQWNDVAINGAGFFQVLTPDGALAFSRNSTLSIDADRYLCSKDGFRLADNIQLPEDFEKITIKANGDVEATIPDDSEPQLLGTIKLARFINPESLNPLGSGLYTATEETADPLIDAPGSSGLGELAQHQIEGSNVDMVNSLMQLTMAQRIYQLNAKAVQIADELEKLTNEIRS